MLRWGHEIITTIIVFNSCHRNRRAWGLHQHLHLIIIISSKCSNGNNKTLTSCLITASKHACQKQRSTDRLFSILPRHIEQPSEREAYISQNIHDKAPFQYPKSQSTKLGSGRTLSAQHRGRMPSNFQRSGHAEAWWPVRSAGSCEPCPGNWKV